MSRNARKSHCFSHEIVIFIAPKKKCYKIQLSLSFLIIPPIFPYNIVLRKHSYYRAQ